MSNILQKLGIMFFWLTWPGIWLVTHLSRRSRVIIVSPDREVLLLKGWLGSGQWILPGGGVHSGESVEVGAIREVYEETGIKLDPEQLKQVYESRMSDHGISFTGIIFVVKLPVKPATTVQRFEISQLEWQPVNDLRGLSPLTKELVDKWAD